ncbi:MAG: hypothetical protein HW416_3766 [Chloroflexi bacterium]|nr:hypothetical protein [Chloroflexota bacterium]
MKDFRPMGGFGPRDEGTDQASRLGRARSDLSQRSDGRRRALAVAGRHEPLCFAAAMRVRGRRQCGAARPRDARAAYPSSQAGRGRTVRRAGKGGREDRSRSERPRASRPCTRRLGPGPIHSNRVPHNVRSGLRNRQLCAPAWLDLRRAGDPYFRRQPAQRTEHPQGRPAR